MSPNTSVLKFRLKGIIISFFSAGIYELLKKKLEEKIIPADYFSKNCA